MDTSPADLLKKILAVLQRGELLGHSHDERKSPDDRKSPETASSPSPPSPHPRPQPQAPPPASSMAPTRGKKPPDRLAAATGLMAAATPLFPQLGRILQGFSQAQQLAEAIEQFSRAFPRGQKQPRSTPPAPRLSSSSSSAPPAPVPPSSPSPLPAGPGSADPAHAVGLKAPSAPPEPPVLLARRYLRPEDEPPLRQPHLSWGGLRYDAAAPPPPAPLSGPKPAAPGHVDLNDPRAFEIDTETEEPVLPGRLPPLPPPHPVTAPIMGAVTGPSSPAPPTAPPAPPSGPVPAAPGFVDLNDPRAFAIDRETEEPVLPGKLLPLPASHAPFVPPSLPSAAAERPTLPAATLEASGTSVGSRLEENLEDLTQAVERLTNEMASRQPVGKSGLPTGKGKEGNGQTEDLDRAARAGKESGSGGEGSNTRKVMDAMLTAARLAGLAVA